MSIDILGHDNYALAIQFDLLKAIHGHLPSLRIISNLPAVENPLRDVPFYLPGDVFESLEAAKWRDKPDAKLLLGAMTGKTMFRIHDFFNRLGDLSPSRFLTLVHPAAVVPESAQLGHGCTIEPGVVISSFTNLADFVWVKRQASIGHHTHIASFTNINPGVTIASGCQIGSQCLIGVGATISDKIRIGDRSIVGAGAVVIHDVPEGKIVVGNPAKVLRDNDNY